MEPTSPKQQPIDRFEGGIYNASDEVIDEIHSKKLYHAPYEEIMTLLKSNQCSQVHTIEGYWSKYLKIDG